MDTLDTRTDNSRLFEQNWFLLLNLVLALTLGSLTLIIELSAAPPVETFADARKALSKARQHQANIYMPETLIDAEYLLEQTKLAWRAENQRWRINRNYHKVNRLARECSTKAVYASLRSQAMHDSLRTLAQTGIRSIKTQIESYRPKFQNMPIDNRLRQKFVLGELYILESEAAFKRQDYKKAVARYQIAEKYIGRAGHEASETLDNYYALAPQWRKWVNQTVAWSRDNNDVAIIVDKLDHTCYLYSAGIRIQEFDIELGPNWLGYKLQRGDNATPEGCYRIKKMKADKQTRYYLAMEIDYPNEQDRIRFYNAKARGDIAHTATIGGLIEIHGDGGKGANWTAGCVALSNRDMEKIYKMCKIGTPVTIVGSTKGAMLNAENRSASITKNAE